MKKGIKFPHWIVVYVNDDWPDGVAVHVDGRNQKVAYESFTYGGISNKSKTMVGTTDKNVIQLFDICNLVTNRQEFQNDTQSTSFHNCQTWCQQVIDLLLDNQSDIDVVGDDDPSPSPFSSSSSSSSTTTTTATQSNRIYSVKWTSESPKELFSIEDCCHPTLFNTSSSCQILYGKLISVERHSLP
ncbi:hypothetical protein DFA_09483 [Cavenderia fasciculata]|uniref:Uncharacterized protein n=1 Tax=Cavenderia fasciculata TaxID=261658 RepID=F4Q7R4_CACFS|nr:uncharacterized protein DFA_09483 [Cavenderia fasciculata]EGG15814.1 hypothetical protein DFA_09483 [Cavenderia fasciculata]|eukprot:XP_004352139.1 hypothetical protein DFA_09483 [Cavenderia fasciculata]